MRKNLIIIAISLTALTTVLRADLSTTEDFDFSRINRSITEAMDSVITTSEVFSKFQYVLDPENTNLSQDRYGFILDIIGKAPWSDTNFIANTKLILGYRSDIDASGFTVDYNVDLSVDATALIRHHARRSRVCESQARATGVLRISMSEDCKILPRLSNIQSMDELFAIFSDHIDSAKLAMQTYRSELINAQRVISPGLTKESLQVQLEDVERYIAAVSKLELKRIADGVRLLLPKIQLSDLLVAEDTLIDISRDDVSVSGRAMIHSNGGIYRAMKPEIFQMLRALENEESYMTSLLQIKTRFWLRLLGEHISGETD